MSLSCTLLVAILLWICNILQPYGSEYTDFTGSQR